VKRIWLRYVLAYLMWGVVLALGIWFIVISRNGLLGAFGTFYVGGSMSRVWQSRFYDRVYIIAVGLLWLVLMVFAEAYFREGVPRRQLLKRFARVVGPEILLILAADLFLFWLQGGVGHWLRWFILGSELVVGVLLVVFAWSSRSSRRDRVRPDEALDPASPD
jgi:hypothetical protein